MKKFKLLLAAIAVLAFSQSLLAQHAGHGGTMGGGGTMAHDSMPDMQKMMVMQASGEQAGHLREWVAATSTARSRTQALQQASSESTQRKEELQKALSDAKQHQQMFLESLTSEQQSGLKKQVAKINKAQAGVDTQLKALDGDISRGDRKRIAQQGQKLDKALADLEKAQRDVASAMGVQG